MLGRTVNRRKALAPVLQLAFEAGAQKRGVESGLVGMNGHWVGGGRPEPDHKAEMNRPAHFFVVRVPLLHGFSGLESDRRRLHKQPRNDGIRFVWRSRMRDFLRETALNQRLTDGHGEKTESADAKASNHANRHSGHCGCGAYARKVVWNGLE